jgi:transcription antitermination factor NusG
MSEGWAIASVWGGRDYRVRDKLQQRGHPVWLPECIVRRTTRARVEISLKLPLFPGYVFVEPGIVWRAIEEVPGVVELLKAEGGERLARLPPAAAIALVRRLEEGGGALVIEEGCRRKRFAEGERVRIVGDAWSGWEGLYVSTVKDRNKILLDIFGRQTETLISEALVEPA